MDYIIASFEDEDAILFYRLSINSEDSINIFDLNLVKKIWPGVNILLFQVKHSLLICEKICWDRKKDLVGIKFMPQIGKLDR